MYCNSVKSLSPTSHCNALREFPPSPQYLAAVHGKQRTLLSLYLSPSKFICHQQNPRSSSEPQIIFGTEVWELFLRGWLPRCTRKERGSLQFIHALKRTEEVAVSSRISSKEKPNLLPPFPSGRGLGPVSSFVHITLFPELIRSPAILARS